MFRSTRSSGMSVLLALAALGCCLDHRAWADVAVRVAGKRAQIQDTSFEVNRKLGRAWVSFFMIDPVFDNGYERAGYRPEPTMVPGLRYNQETKEIVFDEPGQPSVVCARVVPKHFLFIKYNKVEETGSCGITRIVEEEVKQDDGFRISTSAQRRIYFGRIH